ncbi:hypothetical protein GCM10027517_26660 [Phycicoccus ginsengisoli]
MALVAMVAGIPVAAPGDGTSRVDEAFLEQASLLPAVGGCVHPRTTESAAAALAAVLHCHDAALAARARALEFDPVR